MRTRGKDTGITVGGAPRVDLLPPEVRAERRAAAIPETYRPAMVADQASG